MILLIKLINKMGIQNFYKFLRTTYPDAFRQKWLDSYDYIHIDLNHIIHHVVHYSESEQDIVDRLKRYIVNMLIDIVPTKKIMMYIDGKAPNAKSNLQQKRIENLTNPLLIGLRKLIRMLPQQMDDLKAFYKIIYRVDMEIDSISIGEAELKIRQSIDRLPSDSQHLVCSGDSDQILLLMGTKIDNLYVMTNKGTMSMREMFRLHCQKYGDVDKHDFIFVNLLMGNDYLPKIKLVTLNRLWEAWRWMRGCDERLVESVDSNSTDSKLTINTGLFGELLYWTLNRNVMKRRYRGLHLGSKNIKQYKTYIEGLYWCLNMYIDGRCDDYQYIYNYPMTTLDADMVLLSTYWAN
jgi:XRN 5'-3' exonuclease N-terminus